PNITSSKNECIGIARAALDKVVTMLQSNGQLNGALYSFSLLLYWQMAEFDRLTNQTKYKQTLKQIFALAKMTSPEFLTTTNYGYAAAQAYMIYQDSDFLDFAVVSWTSARRYTISKEEAASGVTDVKKFDLSLLCQGATLAGGTYWVSPDIYIYSVY
ncbi:hypothetical protein ARMGADRAFT_941017, partial [Armillaria gallica]